MTALSHFDELRRQAANREWVTFDMGDEVVEDSDGWEAAAPEREMTRTVYFQDAVDHDAATIRRHFTVVFAAVDSTKVVGAYAAINGNIVGQRVPVWEATAHGLSC
jgi:hypothetical protein